MAGNKPEIFYAPWFVQYATLAQTNPPKYLAVAGVKCKTDYEQLNNINGGQYELR
jgi:hypothetical protein